MKAYAKRIDANARGGSDSSAFLAALFCSLLLAGCAWGPPKGVFPNEAGVWCLQGEGTATTIAQNTRGLQAQYQDMVLDTTIGLRPYPEWKSSLALMPDVSLAGEYGGAFSLFSPDQCTAFARLVEQNGGRLPEPNIGLVTQGRLMQAPFALWPELAEAGGDESLNQRVQKQSERYLKIAGMLDVLTHLPKTPLPSPSPEYDAPKLMYAPEVCHFFLKTDDGRWVEPDKTVLGQSGWNASFREVPGETAPLRLAHFWMVKRTFLPITLLYDRKALRPGTKWVELHVMEKRILQGSLVDPDCESLGASRRLDSYERGRHLAGRWVVRHIPVAKPVSTEG